MIPISRRKCGWYIGNHLPDYLSVEAKDTRNPFVIDIKGNEGMDNR